MKTKKKPRLSATQRGQKKLAAAYGKWLDKHIWLKSEAYANILRNANGATHTVWG